MPSFNRDEWLYKHGLTLCDQTMEPPKLLWIDLETTGLDSDKEVILEFGMVITDRFGNPLRDSFYHAYVFENNDHYADRLNGMIEVVKTMHSKSGLLSDLQNVEPVQLKSVNKVQSEVLALLERLCIKKGELYLAGNSVHFDLQFMTHYMYRLVQSLHYRQLNVSSIKIAAQMLSPELYESIMTNDLNPFSLHRSMDDLGDSINEYQSYIDNFLYL